MAQFRFVVDGDFVDFYDGAMHAFRVRNTTQDVDWYYETAPGIKFEVDGHRYNTVPSQIEIDGVTLSANTDFDDAIVGIFPNLASGGGPGGTPGIDDVLAEEQTVISRFIEVQSNGLFEIVVGSTRDLLELDTTEGAEHSLLQATNISGLGSAALLKAETQDGAGQFTFEANYNGEAVQAQINGSASAGGSSIEHTADSHTFIGSVTLPRFTRIINNDDFAAEFSVINLTSDKSFSFPDSSGRLMVVNSMASKQIPYGDLDGERFDSNEDFIFDIDGPTLGIGALNGNSTITSQTEVNAEQPTLTDVGIIIKGANGGETSGNGGDVILTPGNAGGGGGADGRTVLNKDVIITALAGGGTTGLSIDNDGKIIRTP